MTEGINVGSVEVSVVPEARRFNELLRSQITPASDEASRQISKALSRGIEEGISQANVSGRVATKGTEAGGAFSDAFQKRVKAALAALPSAEVKLDDEAAQAKLDYLREELTSLSSQRIGVDVSDTEAVARLTALRAELENLAARSGSIQVNADTAAAAAQLDRFFAETKAKAEVTGDAIGNDLTEHAASAAGHGSPLIMSAIIGGLVAGGPAVSAASILIFGGLAAAAVSTVGSVQDAFHRLKTNVNNDVQGIAEEIAPTFVNIASDAGRAFNQVEPAIHAALVGVAPEIEQIIGDFETGAETAIPAFTRAIQNGQPVVNGLGSLVRDLETGVAGLLDKLTAHSGAEGAVLSELGSALNTLLPMVGTLLGEGAELGSTVLPPLNLVLRLIAGALNLVAPVLPVVVTSFLAFKAVSALSGPLETFSAKLQTVAADADGVKGKLSGLGAQGVAGVQNALPVLGLALAGLGIGLDLVSNQLQKTKDDTQKWAQALLDGGAAADQVHQQYLNQFGGQGPDFLGKAAEALGFAASEKDIADKAKEMYAALGPAQRAQQDVTKAQNDYLETVQKYGPASGQAAGAALTLRDAQERLTTMQGQLNAVTQQGDPVMSQNAARLQGIANMAGQANSEINLLKGALDALTGKAITTDDAEAALTQSINAATGATKGQAGALIDANGQLNLHTAAGAAAYQALKQVAGASNQVIATMEQQGRTVSDVNKRDGELRDSFIHTAEQMGFSKTAAKNLADQIYGIPAQRTTQINADTRTAANILADLQRQIDDMHGRNIAITVSAQGGLATYTTDQRNLLYSGNKAAGGPISGPGTGTSDTAGLFALSNGEHVWTAAEVAAAGGHAGVEALRQAVLASGGGRAAGGPIGVNVDIDERQVDSKIAALKQQLAAATSFTPGAGVAQWTNLVLQALALERQPASLLGITLRRMQQESGGNPRAINLWDSNALRGDPSRGLMQVIGSTFARFHFPGTSSNIYDPLANVLASMNYALSRYGSLQAAYGRIGGYELGTNYVPSDQVALLHKGEAVVPAAQNQGAPYRSGPMQITGRLEIGGDGMATLIGEVLDMATDRGAYNG